MAVVMESEGPELLIFLKKLGTLDFHVDSTEK